MIFRELVLQNFGPYRGRQVIDLSPEVADSTRPIILFGGMNGGGKTTLIDAIRLALYGHRAQCSTRGNLGYSEFLLQSVNYRTKPSDRTCVELAFQHILDGKLAEFRVRRIWEKHSKGSKDFLVVLINGWPDSGLTQTWDERIEELLPLGISNLFLFDGEQVKELAEQETPPQVVIDAIRAVLGLELADRLSIDLDILASRKRKELATEQELITLQTLEQKLKQEQERYLAAKQELASLQVQLDRAIEKERLASERFNSEGGRIAGERHQLEKKLNQMLGNAEAQRQALCELAAGKLPLALIQPLLTQAQVQAQRELHLRQVQSAHNLLMERDQRFLKVVSQLELLPEQIDKIKAFLQHESQLLDQEMISIRPWLAADSITLNQLSNTLNQSLLIQVKLAQERLLTLQNREDEIVSTEKYLAAAAAPEIYEHLAKEVKNAQDNLTEVQTAYEQRSNQCEELAQVVANTKQDLAKYGETMITQTNIEHFLGFTVKVQTTLKAFREQLTLRKLNQLESEVTECFLYLLHKADLASRVVIDVNTFGLSLCDLEGQFIPKHRLSAGEKQLLAIAFLWGLARVSDRNLPVAIDTPLGRLDSSHRTNLVERYFPTASHQVILLSTDTEVDKNEVERLRDAGAIAREYLLEYDSVDQTVVKPGYFW